MHDNVDVPTQPAAFCRRLRRARRQNGDLPFRELAGRMNYASSSTLHRAMQGRTLPTWPVVERLLTDGFGMSADTVRTEWLPLWVAAKDAIDPDTEPADWAEAEIKAAGPSPDARPTSCPQCGVPVADEQIHYQFHEQQAVVTDHPTTSGRKKRLRLA